MSLGKWIGFVVFLISLYVLWRIQQVILLALTAVILATVLNRIVRRLQKSKVNRGVAIALTISLLILILVGVFVLIIPRFLSQISQIVDLIPVALERLRTWIKGIDNLIPYQLIEDVRNLQGITSQLQSFTSNIFGNFFSLFSNTLGILLNTLLVLVLTIMLLADPKPYRKVFILLFPSFYRRRANEILDECEKALGGWAVGILFNMMIIGIFSGIGLWLLGVSLPFTNAILAGLLTFIPNVGPTLSVIPPAALALLDAPWKAGAVVILYIIIQQIESNILTPLVMEKQVSLLPAITLLSQMIFAIFFGLLGLFLALPVVVIAQVWLHEVLVKDILNHWDKEDNSQPKTPLIKIKPSSN